MKKSNPEFKINDRIWFNSGENKKVRKYKVTGYAQWGGEIAYVVINKSGKEGIVLQSEATARGRTKRARKRKQVDFEIGDSIKIAVHHGIFVSAGVFMWTENLPQQEPLTDKQARQLRDALNLYLGDNR